MNSNGALKGTKNKSLLPRIILIIKNRSFPALPVVHSQYWCFARLVTASICIFSCFVTGDPSGGGLGASLWSYKFELKKRKRPKRAELPDANINTGAQSIITGRASLNDAKCSGPLHEVTYQPLKEIGQVDTIELLDLRYSEVTHFARDTDAVFTRDIFTCGK